ncbi:MAG: hypothetical protein L0228_18625 [Planctomycetes bacterium]|nr:hypothetical protein [Planctomycetota bacterium]
MRRAEDNADEMIGQDSFLDVVTNIVGILILLVMVMGMRSSKAAATAAGAAAGTKTLPAINEEQVREAYRAAVSDERDVHELVRRSYDSHSDALLREQERQWIAETVAEVKQEIAARREKLSTNDQRDFDLRRDLTEAQLKLDALTREQVALLAEDSEVEEIKCEPTPIAKAVTGKEIHIQLADDHVAYLPADELTKQMYDDFSQNSWRLKQEDQMIRTIGPMNGFRLQYAFAKTGFVARGRNGVVTSGQAAEFQGFYLLPVNTPVGEPAIEALAPGSELRERLGQVDPTRTTITIWTYPGNYDRLREMKRSLRELGFQTAIRPLPKGRPIGFSPTGSRSVTE